MTQFPFPVFITEDEVRDTHDYVIDQMGGLSGDDDTRPISGALSRVVSQYIYENEENPIELAAWYGFALAEGHCFVDGNKRTATIIMDSYLMERGIDLNLEPIPEELANIIEQVADAKNPRDQSDLAEWLYDRFNEQHGDNF